MRPSISAGICEDDDELRGVLRTALEREGLAVRATASGAEAVRAFGQDPPDVLVLDIGLPDADGRDVCQALRARGLGSPVLFLTARDAVPDPRRARRTDAAPRRAAPLRPRRARPHAGDRARGRPQRR